MDIVGDILSLFNISLRDTLEIEEKLSSFYLRYQVDRNIQVSESSLVRIVSRLPNDDFLLSIQIGQGDPIIISTTQPNVSDFVSQLLSELRIQEDEIINLSFEVSKKFENGCRYIYNYTSFCEFWESNPPLSTLKVLKKDLDILGWVNFIFLEEGKTPMQTANISFGYDRNQEANKEYKCTSIKENCHFGNYEEFPFNPNCFDIRNRPSEQNSITNRFDQFKLLMCICGIYDITSINDNKLCYKINGYKSFIGEISIPNISTDSSGYYLEIFNWIYSESSNISDKIGLARNILSIYLDDDSIQIESNVFDSIRSSYKTYLQNNVSRYIQIRSNIHDNLSWISQKSGELINDHLDNYKKSISVFLTFFISVFLIQAFQTGKLTGVFSKETTILCLSFLILSLIYLFFSIWNLDKEKTRLKSKYDNIKERYKDLLIEDDINKILRNNEEFNAEYRYICKRQRSITLLWSLTIIILFLAILTFSTYLNFAVIKSAFCH